MSAAGSACIVCCRCPAPTHGFTVSVVLCGKGPCTACVLVLLCALYVVGSGQRTRAVELVYGGVPKSELQRSDTLLWFVVHRVDHTFLLKASTAVPPPSYTWCTATLSRTFDCGMTSGSAFVSVSVCQLTSRCSCGLCAVLCPPPPQLKVPRVPYHLQPFTELNRASRGSPSRGLRLGACSLRQLPVRVATAPDHITTPTVTQPA